jgi:hypothetical protein
MKIKTEQNFINVVKSMTSSEIIETMVKGLKKPVTNISMTNYGIVRDGICYGCAATNTICKIAGINLKEFLLINPTNTMEYLFNTKSEFINRFETAINFLRLNDIMMYNCVAEEINIARIKNTDFNLPTLNSNYTSKKLKEYLKLAELEKIT